ncbi:IS66 family insertion sequence element accessory protein TnpB [Pseudomonas sp.]|uniref:IS66 family insertion sequence element accessory protein TnpB n=1 Tax=Pseudomonas sp. TaxID=306 RepID=UPI003D115088
MRCGFGGRATKVQMHLESGPPGRHFFAFRGRHGDRIKGLSVRRRRVCLSCKCLKAGRFVWSQVEERHMGKDASAGCGWWAWVVSKYGKILLPLLEMHSDIVHTSPGGW